MANVSNVHLNIVKTGDVYHSVTVTFTIYFSSQEIKENLSFGLYIPLFEVGVGDQLDTYHWEANGAGEVGMHWRRLGDLDEFHTWVAVEGIRPDGIHGIQQHRFKPDVPMAIGKAGKIEYIAFVWVIPEIVEGKAWSNRAPLKHSGAS